MEYFIVTVKTFPSYKCHTGSERAPFLIPWTSTILMIRRKHNLISLFLCILFLYKQNMYILSHAKKKDIAAVAL